MSSNRGSTLLRNLRWGVLYGLAYAAVASVWVAVIALARHETYFAQYGLALAQLIALYALAGVAGGIVVGLLRPLTGHPIGAAAVGVIAGIPAMLVFFIALSDDPRPLTNIDWRGGVLLSTLIGGPTGYLRWRRTYGASTGPKN